MEDFLSHKLELEEFDDKQGELLALEEVEVEVLLVEQFKNSELLQYCDVSDVTMGVY